MATKGKKEFKENASASFLEETDTQKAKSTPAKDGEPVPMGYKYLLVRESKSERTQILLRPTTKEVLKQAAERRGMSMNGLINELLDDFASKERGEDGN